MRKTRNGLNPCWFPNHHNIESPSANITFYNSVTILTFLSFAYEWLINYESDPRIPSRLTTPQAHLLEFPANLSPADFVLKLANL